MPTLSSAGGATQSTSSDAAELACTEPLPPPPSPLASMTDAGVAGNQCEAYDASRAPLPPTTCTSGPGDGPTIPACVLELVAKKAPAPPKSSKASVIPSCDAVATETTPAKEPNTRPVQTATPWISQYDDKVELRWKDGTAIAKKDRDSACWSATREMLSRAGAHPNMDRAVLVPAARDGNGRIEPNAVQARAGRAVIDAELEAGRPVMVGVTWTSPHMGEVNRGTADHFVAVTGRGTDQDGRVYYTFNEPGVFAARTDVGRDTRPENRFYVDESTGLLFRPKVQGGSGSSGARYEASLIVPNARTPVGVPTAAR